MGSKITPNDEPVRGFPPWTPVFSTEPLPELGIAKPAHLEEIVKAKSYKIELFRYGEAIYVLHFPFGNSKQYEVFGRPNASLLPANAGKFPEEPLYGVEKALGMVLSDIQLTDFFNLAEGNKLTEPENWLLHLLLENGILVKEGAKYLHIQPEKAIISVSDRDAIRNSRLSLPEWIDVHAHELSHGEFDTNKAYRDYCKNFWNQAMTPRDRERFELFLIGRSYISEGIFAISEFQAYFVNTGFVRDEILQHFPEKRYEELRAAFIKDSPVPNLYDAIQHLARGEQ